MHSVQKTKFLRRKNNIGGWGVFRFCVTAFCSRILKHFYKNHKSNLLIKKKLLVDGNCAALVMIIHNFIVIMLFGPQRSYTKKGCVIFIFDKNIYYKIQFFCVSYQRQISEVSCTGGPGQSKDSGIWDQPEPPRTMTPL